ncbi:unnamed protein product, partial [Heterosigma akashiwo]
GRQPRHPGRAAVRVAVHDHRRDVLRVHRGPAVHAHREPGQGGRAVPRRPLGPQPV